jgi:hypothetical protein
MKDIKLPLFVLCTVLCLNLSAGAARTDLNYTWKVGELFRFEYSKTIIVKDSDAEERRTELSAVLILEIKSASPSGTLGILRMDSPRLTLPPFESFMAHDDDVKAQPERMKIIAHAVEGAIKAARWNVVFSPDGALQLESRTPANTAEWLKEVASIANWRKKSHETLIKIIETDLGLKVPATERELLLCLTPAPATEQAAELVPHPRRILQNFESKKDDRVAITFKRELEKSPAPFTVPNLVAPRQITGTVSGVATRDGTALFDTKLGMLDSLNESYSGRLKYLWGNAEQFEQEVRVEYKLKRLAPAIRTE